MKGKKYASFVDFVQWPRALLAGWGVRALSLPMRRNQFWAAVAAYFLCLACGSQASAYTTVVLSPSTPETIESELIADLTNQFNIQLTVNPYFPNTYQLTVLGVNPAYNPQPTNADLLNAVVTVDSYTYVYGWADGAENQNTISESMIANYYVNCSTPTAFNLAQSTVSTFSAATCQDVTQTIFNSLYQLQLSTPPVLNGFN